MEKAHYGMAKTVQNLPRHIANTSALIPLGWISLTGVGEGGNVCNVDSSSNI